MADSEEEFDRLALEDAEMANAKKTRPNSIGCVESWACGANPMRHWQVALAKRQARAQVS